MLSCRKNNANFIVACPPCRQLTSGKGSPILSGNDSCAEWKLHRMKRQGNSQPENRPFAALDQASLAASFGRFSPFVPALSGPDVTSTPAVAPLTRSVGTLSPDVEALSDDVVALTGNLDSLSVNVGALSGNVAALSRDVFQLSGNIGSLSGNVLALSGNVFTLTIIPNKLFISQFRQLLPRTTNPELSGTQEHRNGTKLPLPAFPPSLSNP